MDQTPTLDAYLEGLDPSLHQGNAVATVITSLAGAAVELADLIAAGQHLRADLSTPTLSD